MLCKLPKFHDDKLLVGLETSDDAAVYELNDEQAIIQTLDFFTPIVDDPYLFGEIAAANALSDIYAMGGKPILALNIVGFPTCLDINILGEILKGGADKVAEAGALLVGGHTIEDQEPKYGLSVTGMVHPKKVLKNIGALPGDVLIITKPIGTGILNTCQKEDLLTPEEAESAAMTMKTLNKAAAENMLLFDIHACTDVTGFGLGGHACEMAEGSHVTIVLEYHKIPVLAGSENYAKMGLVPAGTYKNHEYRKHQIQGLESLPDYMGDLIFDPQTSGGLLIALKPEAAAELLRIYETALHLPFGIVGHVEPYNGSHYVVVKE